MKSALGQRMAILRGYLFLRVFNTMCRSPQSKGCPSDPEDEVRMVGGGTTLTSPNALSHCFAGLEIQRHKIYTNLKPSNCSLSKKPLAGPEYRSTRIKNRILKLTNDKKAP